MLKFKLFIYYALISKLPHSRLSNWSNYIRVWYVSKVLRVCKWDLNTKFEPRVYISNSKRLQIGFYCRINEGVFLQGDIQIGNFVMIAPNVSLYSETHVFEKVDVPMVKQGLTDSKKITIEDDVWLGRNVVVLPGVNVGTGSIVGSNSVVTKNVEPYTIVGGVPAKVIRRRD